MRFLQSRVFKPFDLPVVRTADNLRATNPYAIEALREAGFRLVYEQKLRWFEVRRPG